MKTRKSETRWAVLAAVLAAAALAAGCAGKHSLLLPEEALTPAPVIVVLGYGPPVDAAGRPVDELTRRVAKGVQLYQAGLAPKLIMTGGNTYRDYYESAVMKQVAVASGVPAEAVLEEREAMDTIGNARYSAAIMRAQGWDRCILVSSPYHLKRARKLFEAAGVEVQTAEAAVPADPGYAIKFTIYENWVRFQYAFIDEQALVRGDQGDAHTKRMRAPVRARTEGTP
jgi:uncharacterized SAM-binding protein YcdF (DUF218 family)